jgi:hypothetical protein
MLYIRMATADAVVLSVDALAREIAEQPPREARKETGFLWWMTKITVDRK